MNSYFIFAIVLTVAYIIYYAVIIAHDLYGKKGTNAIRTIRCSRDCNGLLSFWASKAGTYIGRR